MGMKFTPEQQRVIELHNSNILVSAAAGSGKTAVLVDVFIRMISAGEHPADIDRLLIVTFTNAAAAEMRERIAAGITARLEADPGNEHIQKQSALLHNARQGKLPAYRDRFRICCSSTLSLPPGQKYSTQAWNCSGASGTNCPA